ncbi:flagellar motor switch protein FliN/FliY [Arthrobacter pigmenti]|uniref:Flagellar motor switch protein FliN/FliY n=1 Tax=Arthrobacter pigmenti TaxID=271432 RepID=A0A846RHR1_9MICC|nr:flagellar motor switch protein FliN [Arthrobacter pigmenti]NJC21240.1 flagellar motor switch protein FliN/FliY [Arthrobacter pigmenti]
MTTAPASTRREGAAADALASLLPTPRPVRAVPAHGAQVPAAAAAAAVVVSFVGAHSAEMAIALADSSFLAHAAGTDSTLISAADVLTPALEAAAGALGDGVLGDAETGDATALLSAPDARLFQLNDDDGATRAWFAIRVRAQDHTRRSAASNAVGRLSRISNVEMAMTVEIGRTRMSVRDVLDLEPGGVIELDRSAGAPADVLLNGRLIAHGEVVVVDQDYAVRITQILDVSEGPL